MTYQPYKDQFVASERKRQALKTTCVQMAIVCVTTWMGTTLRYTTCSLLEVLEVRVRELRRS